MKKKFKFLVSVLMVTVLMGSLLTGCGGEGIPGPGASGSNVENGENNKPADQVTLKLNLTDYVVVYQNAQDDGTSSVRAIVNTNDIAKILMGYTIGWYDESTLKRTLEGRDNHNIDFLDLVYVGEGGFDDLNNQVYGCSDGDVVTFHVVVNERGLKLLKQQVPGVAFVWEESIEYTVSASKTN